jgi:hypothetical protein
LIRRRCVSAFLNALPKKAEHPLPAVMRPFRKKEKVNRKRPVNAPTGRTHLYYCGLSEIEIEIAIEIEKAWELVSGHEFDFDETIYMRLP